jgi:hypothetical protein
MIRAQFAVSAACVIVVLMAASPAKAESPNCPPDLSGQWRGSWESCVRGHHGPLAARFERIDDCHYLVHFHGRACKVMPFCYSVTMSVTGYDGDTVFLSASSHLPIFGTFECCASANNCHFEARYSAASDQGQFRLERR